MKLSGNKKAGTAKKRYIFIAALPQDEVLC